MIPQQTTPFKPFTYVFLKSTPPASNFNTWSPTAGEYIEAWITKEPKWLSFALGGTYTRFTMPDYKQRLDAMRLQAWHSAQPLDPIGIVLLSL
jgi:hypothetical protein